MFDNPLHIRMDSHTFAALTKNLFIMKKAFLSLLLLAGLATANAQNITFGVKAGANFSNLVGKDAKDLDPKPKIKVGVYGGGFVNIGVSENFAIQPEVLYSAEGAQQKESGETAKWNLNYVNIPVLAQYRSSGFIAETGPQIGFLTSAKVKISNSADVDIKDQLKSTAFSWCIGIGYQLENGFGFGARYNLGIGTIADDSDTKIMGSNIQVGVHYAFGGKAAK